MYIPLYVQMWTFQQYHEIIATFQAQDRESICSWRLTLLEKSSTFWQIYNQSIVKQQTEFMCQFIAIEATSWDVGGWLKRQLLFSSALMTADVEWTCGPPAGEYTVIWSSCAYRQCMRGSAGCSVYGCFLCASGTDFKSTHRFIKKPGDSTVYIGPSVGNLMEMFAFILKAQMKLRSAALQLWLLLSHCENRWFIYHLCTTVYVLFR